MKKYPSYVAPDVATFAPDLASREERLKSARNAALFDRRESGQKHASYAHEKEGFRIIREGLVDQLDDFWNTPMDGTAGKLSENPLRNAKDMMITAVTTATRAAMDGGLPEELAYATSDIYIQTAEHCSSIDELDQLYRQMYFEFTSLVAEYQRHRYSAAINDAIHYIQIHLHDELSLAKIAAGIHLSPTYLSRLFKKETGISIVDHIQKERVEAAKHMLAYGPFTTDAISEYLHFSTQSYFIKVFKKYEGVTPGEYRKYNRKGEMW